MVVLSGSFDARFTVISVRAPNGLGPFAFRWLEEVATDGGLVVDPLDAAAATATITRFIEEAISAYSLDRERVFIAGFSQGGILALATMLTAPQTVAGVVCMSGRLPAEVLASAAPRQVLAGKSVLIVHGRQDETLAVANGRLAYALLEDLQVAVEYSEFDMAHGTTEESLARVSGWLTAMLDN